MFINNSYFSHKLDEMFVYACGVLIDIIFNFYYANNVLAYGNLQNK